MTFNQFLGVNCMVSDVSNDFKSYHFAIVDQLNNDEETKAVGTGAAGQPGPPHFCALFSGGVTKIFTGH